MPVMLAGRSGSRREVLAANEAARALGVRPGMSATEAQALLPHLATYDAEPKEDEAGLGRLASWALRCYSPVVAADPPDGLVLDVTGAVHLHGSEAALLNDIVARLARVKVTARAAMAGTLGSAHALARHHGKPVVALSMQEGSAALARMPVSSLRLAPHIVQGLKLLGFKRVGDLLAQPRAPLVHRFGQELGRRLDQALGHAAEPITPVVVPDMISVTRGFGEPISAAETLQRYTQTLVGELCLALEKRGLGARKLDLVFHRVDSHVEGIRVGTARPTRESKHLSRLLLSRLDTVDPGFGVERMTLVTILAEPLGYRPSSALGEKPRPDVTTLVDTLSTRVGPDRLYRLALVESDVPERSVSRVAPLSEPTIGRWPLSWPRPSRLLTPPEPIETIALLPDHPPATFTWRGSRHRVIRADGPERIHGEWIRSDDEIHASRDYFLVEDEAGLRFWLYRLSQNISPDAGPHRWFLHGLFP